jgi:metal-dependent amidase/aminoacylase/carboxypeptidase family protein
LGAQKDGLEGIPAHSSTFDFDENALGVGAAFLAEAAKLTIEQLS